ncbi:MAG TPA: sigma-70 family RNA polymerase sigma factor [Mycobacteriales bacterium]|nr:sigma-70 family RNA polymerase sigma factor [Mycobacteriales bacterium]
MAGDDEADLVRRLQAGDEQAFVDLVNRYHKPLLRLALSFVSSPAIAEEVVQDTWVGVIRGIDRFEGRSSLATWLFRIVTNRARTTGVRESRSKPVDLTDEASAPPELFTADGAWAEPPRPWTDAVEDRLVAAQAAPHVRACLDALPETQRQVVTLRDVEGQSAEEVCALLGLTAVNQRVLLHRGRARVRACLTDKIGEV